MEIREGNLVYESNQKLPQELIEALNEGLADLKAGRVVPHKEAMRQIRESLSREKL